MKDGKPYGFAGLWDKWKDPVAGGAELLTFTVITTDPNEVVSPIHTRMPVIIEAKNYDRWLQRGDPQQPPIDLLQPFDADKMKAWRVGKEVGNVKNDTPKLLMPDNVVEMGRPLTDEELFELEGRDHRGESDPPPPRKKLPPKPENLKLDF
jgi:putative SOS response-associated peptidase YedK